MHRKGRQPSKGIPEIRHIVLPVVLLSAFGLMMVYSSSSPFSSRVFGEETWYFQRQSVFMAVGMFAFFAGAKIPFLKYRRLYPLLMVLTLFLLVLTLIPGISAKVYGARRWLKIGPIGIQPVELLKLTMLVWVADFLVRKKDVLTEFSRSILPSFAVAGIFLALLLLQPDFGNAFLIMATLLFVVMFAGARIHHVGFTFLLFGALASFLIYQAPYRMRRINAFLDPWADPTNSGYQLINSLISFGSGGMTGRGLGNSLQKKFFLPQAHTDFIFAIIGEELGFLGVCLLVAGYLAIFLIGLKAVIYCRNDFGRNLGFGVLMIFILQAIMHMGVTVGLLPTKGIGLPLVSYGGSSLVLTLFMLGILFNIGTEGRSPNVAKPARQRKSPLRLSRSDSIRPLKR